MRFCPQANRHGFCRKLFEAVSFYFVPHRSYTERSKYIAGVGGPPSNLEVISKISVSASLGLQIASAGLPFCSSQLLLEARSLSPLGPQYSASSCFHQSDDQKVLLPTSCLVIQLYKSISSAPWFFGENCTDPLLSFPPLLSQSASSHFAEKLNPYGTPRPGT